MASSNPGATGQPGHGRTAATNQTFFEKRSMSALRTSTPGSEALESSDDEREAPPAMSASMHSIKSNPLHPVAQRRSSWLSEVQQSTAQAKPRKFSVGGASHASSGSQPTTPLNENGPWDFSGSASRPGTGSMWGSQIWQKDRPSRLIEVMPSPSSSIHHDDMRSPTSIAPGGLPFDIPLEPNRKTIRSQSYSAGQLEKNPGIEQFQQNQGYSRMRSVVHRPSRPSMLGDGSRDMLSSLREDEDDNEDLSGSDNGYPLQHTTSLQNPPRALNTFGKAPSPMSNAVLRSQQRSSIFPMSPGSDYAVGEEDVNDSSQDLGRAMARNVIGGSSNGSSSSNLTVVAPSAARSKWQSQLGFGVPDDGSQSRRHSFAAEHLPSRTRNNSVATTHAVAVPPEFGQQISYGGYNSLNSPFAQVDASQQIIPQATIHEQHDREYTIFASNNSSSSQNFNTDINNSVGNDQNSALNVKPHHSSHQYFDYDHVVNALSRHLLEHDRRIRREQQIDRSYAASYFGGSETMRRNMRDAAEPYNPFALPNVFSRPQRSLYLVAFKCSRADIYYIPENTGLQVKSGDTVIVEGDRGQDLGTVEANLTNMEEAKQLKEEYLRKQYKCLMMFSRMYPHIAAIANDDEQFEQAIVASKSMQQNGMHGGSAQQESEPRPKMIKRVARPDEVHLLREKEGNEAKAKRVCQTKVNDHGLRMEILDAEFQHDYRKLTFFYYAEEYINFNDLVTDLFKVYKTRIWMSAINPASFTGAGNPHTGQRAQQWPRQGAHANYMRSDSQHLPMDGHRTQSPLDHDTPAARGNREYERLYGNTGYPTSNMGILSSMDRMASMAHADFQPSLPSPYGLSGAAPSQFSPNANQFTPFANQFGNLNIGIPWAGPGLGMQSYQQPDAGTANYAVGPASTSPIPTLHQQATSFTPRTIGPQQQPNQRQAANQGQVRSMNGNGNKQQNGQEQGHESIEDQMRRFHLNQRPQ